MKRYIAGVLLILTHITYSQTFVKGKVFDGETQEPMAGVSILVQHTQSGATTASDGTFTITGARSFDSLEVSYIGYQSQKVKVRQGEPLNIGLVASVTTMKEIVVTASRDEQLRSDAPMAINKLSPTTISDAKPTLIVELINKVPGVAMLNYNNEQHAMAIRQPMGTNAYFLYMEDGIPLRPMGVFNHNALIEMNIFAVSNIEVVKGPASSLYGPEAVGGVINFISQKPTAMPTARLGLQFDNFGYKRVQYGAGGMISRKSGLYVGGFYAKQQNGWMTYSDYDKNSINARWDYTMSAKTKLTLAGSYNDYYSQTPGSVDSVAFYNRAYVSTSDFTYREVKALRVRLSTEHAWNENNHTALHLFYRDNSIGQNPSYGIRWTTGQTAATGEINVNDFKSQGFILQHAINVQPLRTRLIAGVSLDHSPNTYDAHRIDLNAQLRADGRSVEKYSIIEERPDIRIADYNADLVNSAVYLQAAIKPIEKLTVTLGGRYDNMSFDYTNYLDHTTGKRSYEQFTPKIGATYSVTEDAGLYANYSQGFSPPGLTSVFRKKPNTDPAEFYYNLTPARFTNYEAGGWVSLIKNTLDADVALYHMAGTNELLNIRQPDNSTDYQSAGKTTHKGIEYGLTYRPDAQWMIRFGGTNALHRFDEFVLSTRSTDQVQNVNGKVMPTAPSWIANSEVIFKPESIKGFRIGVEWQRMSSWYQNQVNTVKYEDKGVFGMKGISVLNFRTGYKWKGAEVFMNVMNLTDELYAFSATRGNNTTDRATYTPAPPRTFVFGIQYNFTGKS